MLLLNKSQYFIMQVHKKVSSFLKPLIFGINTDLFCGKLYSFLSRKYPPRLTCGVFFLFGCFIWLFIGFLVGCFANCENIFPNGCSLLQSQFWSTQPAVPFSFPTQKLHTRMGTSLLYSIIHHHPFSESLNKCIPNGTLFPYVALFLRFFPHCWECFFPKE